MAGSLLLYKLKTWLSFGCFPISATWSSFLYFLGVSGDSAPSLRIHLKKLARLLLWKVATDDRFNEMVPPPPISTILEKIPKRALGMNECVDYGKICCEMPSGRKVHWIHRHPDLRKDDPVLVYIHGGALFLQCFPEHVEYMLAVLHGIRRKNPDSRLSIAFLDYSLLPDVKFPKPLEDCIDAYNDLTINQGFKNIIISGDSAGALLSVTLMAALAKGIETRPKEKNSDVKPAGSVLFAPWFGSLGNDNSGSYKRNKYRDNLLSSGLKYWADIYAGKDEALFNTPWINPCLGSEEFWNNTINPKRTFVIYGSAEILADQNIMWINKTDIPARNVFVDDNGYHESYIYDFLDSSPRDRYELPSYVQVTSWIEELINSN